jgi:hypothetical protein
MELTEVDTGGDIRASAPPPQLLPSDTEELEAARFSTQPSWSTSVIMAPMYRPPAPLTTTQGEIVELQIKKTQREPPGTDRALRI